ncbi:MAG: cob(I)yrinic acid a,c-diamide adenosyltransferase [Candidatus Thorarchaeota archaeon]|jgi:cob(I)alamin adenosyltransferase
MSKHIYTRKGDKGETGLLSGERIGKDNPRVEAYGTVDELITVLGIAKSHLDFSSDPVAKYIHYIQQLLFYVAAELATNPERVDPSDSIMGLRRASAEDVRQLENIADELTEKLPPLTNFVIPGGIPAAAFLHQARTVCRRAERRIITFSKEQNINPELIRYLNRLSDLLFVMARYVNQEKGDGDFIISREGVTHQTSEDRE